MSDNSNNFSTVLVGSHILADLQGIEAKILQDPDQLMGALRDSLTEFKFTILSEKVHQFETQGFGVTGFFLLSESHAAFHSYPEFNYLSLDIFSCGTSDPRSVVKRMSERLQADLDETLVERVAQLPNP